MEKILKPAQLVTHGGDWNTMPKRLDLEQAIVNNLPGAKFVDVTSGAYWTNTEDTAVFAIERHAQTEPWMALHFAKAMHEMKADEFDIKVSGDYYVVRLWWD